MKKAMKVFSAILCAVLLITSGVPAVKTVSAAETVRLSNASFTMTPGESVSTHLAYAQPSKISWSSSDSKIASVDKDGTISAVSAGTATISAKYNGKSYECKVTVKKARLEYARSTIETGEKLFLRYFQNGIDYAYKNGMEWSSSAPEIAEAGKYGLITAKKPGKAKITAKYGKNSVSIQITVKKAAAYTKAKHRTINEKLTAAEVVGKMKTGINLGGTFENYNFDDSKGWDFIGGGSYATSSPQEMEIAWGKEPAVVTRANITAIKNAGFNTIRIPVTWFKAADKNNNIRADWMARVKEVVDYAYDNGMYIILNTHHDERLFKLMDGDMAESEKTVQKIWGQIAKTFRNYDEHLIFESFNEPRTVGSPDEWSGGTEEERKNLNRLNQVFVNTVRASGSNNEQRMLMISCYGAKVTALDGLTIPEDSAENKIIATVHEYEPFNFALNVSEGYVKNWSKDNPDDTGAVDYALGLAAEFSKNRGVPVIAGEFAAINWNNTPDRAEYTEYYVKKAKEYNIPCLWWDGQNMDVNKEYDWGFSSGFGLFDRKTNKFKYPEIADAMIKGIK